MPISFPPLQNKNNKINNKLKNKRGGGFLFPLYAGGGEGGFGACKKKKGKKGKTSACAWDEEERKERK
jgi:hypothetical protein